MITIVHLITGLETGGAERVLSDLVASTDRDRFRSVVVSIREPGKMASAVVRAGVELRTLGIRRGMPNPRRLFHLDRVLREARPEILQTWLYHADFLGLLARRLGRVPHLVWNIRCSDASLSPADIALRRLLAWGSRMPDAVVVNARAGRRFHERIGYHPRHWEHIPNGFDTNEFRPDPEARGRIRAEFGIDDETILIGLPARYHPMKDHETFLDAAAILTATRPQVRFALLGAGIEPANGTLAKAIPRRGIGDRILLLGERSDMAEIYAAFDIATLSSAFGEGFPNVMGEAMASALPCVATDSGDAAELLGPTGIVVPPRDPQALAAAWRKLVDLGAEGRRLLGDQARERIGGEYCVGATVARYEALYSDIVARSEALRARGASTAASTVSGQ
jgi:glycosyltransferase involved in cell wall biosynthesis